MHLILASQSPRRKELLAQIGLTFTVKQSDCEEKIEGTDPEEIVKSLSRQKAKAVAENAEKGYIVLGADTIVVLDGRILGKPRDEEDAFRMLQGLQGREHMVYTGVTLIQEEKGLCVSFAEGTKVSVWPMSGEEIRDYIKTGEPMDKAGAYGIQGRFAAFIEKIEGDYTNVVGLPLARVYHELKKMG
jgi:septum formation protein